MSSIKKSLLSFCHFFNWLAASLSDWSSERLEELHMSVSQTTQTDLWIQHAETVTDGESTVAGMANQ